MKESRNTDIQIMSILKKAVSQAFQFQAFAAK